MSASSRVPSGTAGRKDDHLEIVLGEDVGHRTVSSGFERYRFDHEALPELDFDQVDLSVELLGRRLSAPLVIGAMTGGTERAGAINRSLAEAAAGAGVALALGSGRVILEEPDRTSTYAVRDVAPDVLLFANLGAVQLRKGVSIDDCARLVEQVGADALFLHLNPLQEVVQPEGDTTFGGLAGRIEELVRGLDVPVLVKEVGAGISEQTARLLVEAGVAGIEVAGAGGTSWALIETLRGDAPRKAALGRTFADWGIPTAESIQAVRRAFPEGLIVGSGGIRSGLDAAKAIALGANAVAAAAPFLASADQGPAAVLERIELFLEELRTACFLTGSRTIEELASRALVAAHPVPSDPPR